MAKETLVRTGTAPGGAGVKILERDGGALYIYEVVDAGGKVVAREMCGKGMQSACTRGRWEMHQRGLLGAHERLKWKNFKEAAGGGLSGAGTAAVRR